MGHLCMEPCFRLLACVSQVAEHVNPMFSLFPASAVSTCRGRISNNAVP